MTTTVYVPDAIVVTLAHVQCGVCRIHFAMPGDMVADRKQDGSTFWCPNGHGVSYTSNELGRLKRELSARQADVERMNKQIASKNAEISGLESENVALGRKIRARKAVTTRLKNRIVAGQCPCCSKKFKDLKTHMAAEHPSYDVDKETSARETKV